jgi:hypothetical protein
MLVRCRSAVLTFPSSFQQLAMFGRQRLLLLMPHFCPSVSTFVQDLAPLSTAAWAAATHARRLVAVYQTGQFGPFCLMRTPFCSSFRFGFGDPCVMALGTLLLVSTVIHVTGATGVVW